MLLMDFAELFACENSTVEQGARGVLCATVLTFLYFYDKINSSKASKEIGMSYTGEYEFELDEHLGGYSAQLIVSCEELVFPSEHEGKRVVSVWADDCGASNRLLTKSVHIPEGILHLEGTLFECFSNLEEISIPASVELIEPTIFASCSSLKKITVDPRSKHFRVIGGNLYSRDRKRLIYVPGGSRTSIFEVPDFVRVIGREAFAYSFVKSVILPEGVAEIEENAFFSASLLNEISLPYSLEKIDDFAFAYCKSLERIVIPETVEKIGYDLFFECDEGLKVLCEAEGKMPYWDSGWAEGFEVFWGYRR